MASRKQPRAQGTRTAAEQPAVRGAAPPPRRARTALVAAVAAVVLACALGAWYYLARRPAVTFARTGDQNVLLITIDTLRADALGCYGGRAATPNLDRLASLGIRFDFAHAHAVITLPSHASILTGLYPYQHGIHDNAGFRLPPAIPTLATMLKARGMATGAFVGSFAVDSRFGLNPGFDVYDEHYGQSDMSAGLKMAERRADAVVAPAVAWIAKQQGAWFAWVHVFDPHAPYDPPEPYASQYAGRPYDGEVAFTDAALAPLLDAARAAGRRTLVVVTGDHGEGLGDHGEMTHGLFAYEATLRIPLVVAQVGGGTGGAPSGRPEVSSIDARHVDLVPTILDALAAPKADGLPGRTLLPGPLQAGERPSYFEAHSTTYNRGWAPLTGILVNRDKYIDLPLAELYDLAVDPAEATNLVDRQAERRRTLENRLRAFNAPEAGAARTQDAEARARLQTLGYVSGNAERKAHYGEEDDPKRLVALDRQLRRAGELYESHRLPEAVEQYRQVISARPTMEITYAQLAMLQWEMGRPAEAIATLRASIGAGCDSVAIRTTLGTYLAESGNVKEAIPLLQRVTSGSDGDVDALNALGIALARAGQATAAQATFERLLRVHPGNVMALENLGSIALGGGRMDDARRYFSRAIEADPHSTQANNGLGVVELSAGNRAAAIEHFREAVARDPENYDALYNLATELAKAGQAGAARPYLEQFARTAPPAFYARDIERVRAALARMSR